MADPATTTTATPPAATGGITMDQVNAAVAKALEPITGAIGAINKNQEVLASTIAQLPPAPAAKKTDAPAAATAVTADDVARIVGESIAKLQQTNQAATQRGDFIKGKLAKMPAAYANQLGNDPTKWEAEAATIQAQYEADLRAQGFKPVDIKPANPQGTTPAAAPVDVSKMTSSQQRDAALKGMAPVGPTTSTPAQAAATESADKTTVLPS